MRPGSRHVHRFDRRSRSVRPLLLAAVVFGLLGIPARGGERPESGLPRAEPAEVGMDAAPLAEIAARMQGFVDEQQISGAVTLVARRGRVVHLEAVGHADLEARRPMKTESLFAVASMTKPITATAVLILQDEGKLSIDDPVSRHLPELSAVQLEGGERPGREITIRDALTHTAGFGGSQQTERTLQQTVELIAQRPLSFEPGAKWQYSPGLSVAGRVVEVVAGRPFDEFLAERIFRPLDMRDTTFRPSAEQQQRIARLYEPGETARSLKPATHWLIDLDGERAPNPSGGLFSTAADLARFYQAILDGGELDGRRIVSKRAVEEMTRVQTDSLATGFTPGNGWGLGWCVVREPQGVTRMLSRGTFGHGGAFGTQGWVDPEREMIVVLLVQRTNFGNSDGSAIRETLQDLAVRAVRE
ncbi:MAG TPA: serine hydrolase domain-containing protein [Planctomycetaceae bacterium]|nr:serine hydrolase domain-containing protein [Planctomycetaceae bacterium]